MFYCLKFYRATNLNNPNNILNKKKNYFDYQEIESNIINSKNLTSCHVKIKRSR